VGRAAELSALAKLLGAEAPGIGWVHGLGGVGRSALVRAFARAAQDRAAFVSGIVLLIEHLSPTFVA
jgi:hypothetical protein